MSEANNKSKLRRSWLQTLILTSLNEEAVPSITALAERLNRQRPTVSRSLKNLHLAGLVSQSPVGWTLTDAGREQAREQSERLQRSADNMNSAIRRNVELSQIFSPQRHLEQTHYANSLPSFLRQLESVQSGYPRQYEPGASRDIACLNTLADKAALAHASLATRQIDAHIGPARAALGNERAKIDAAVSARIPQVVPDAKAMRDKATGFSDAIQAHSSLVAGIDACKNTVADQLLAQEDAERARRDALTVDQSVSRALFADVGRAQQLASNIDVNSAAAALDPWKEELAKQQLLMHNADIAKAQIADIGGVRDHALGIDMSRAMVALNPWKEELGRRQAFIDVAGMDKGMAMNAGPVASAASQFKDQAVSLSRVIEEASKAQTFATNISADWMKKAQFADLNILAADRGAISAMIADTLQIGSLLDAARDTVKSFTQVTPVLDTYAKVADIYGDLHRERMSLIAPLPTITPQEMFGIILPTTSMKAYGRSIRHYVAAELDSDEPVPETIADRRLGDYLEPRLAKLDQRLVRVWRGIWQVLRSDSEDKVSQSTGSACELLRMVLDHLAPDEAVPAAKDGQPTRKERVRYLLGKHSVVDYVEAMARATEEMYQRLNAFKHHGIHVELSALSAVTACEALILDILVHVEMKGADGG